MFGSITRSHYAAQRMAAQHEGLLRMHTDNFIRAVSFNDSQIERHFGYVKRMPCGSDFVGQRRISLGLNQCAGIENHCRTQYYRRFKRNPVVILFYCNSSCGDQRRLGILSRHIRSQISPQQQSRHNQKHCKCEEDPASGY
ncbi:hypothetical protein D3C75_964690 [compost metagenome]